ncbi:Major Facilitator Superfamily transporter [Hyella patelloides LEGE 07179]|uniref:Major Facilitator Superfamily transporter n=1 Tax=Hyella patelloides LEGE 07179 TaxID=945734 RepID=A0A563VPF9_9CYAN|nr:MFS transporter [Hyella patelloides]VEP13352.1 Major Facilitator Superfamily transporter [Hyella patelloides LEGE 07179]
MRTFFIVWSGQLVSTIGSYMTRFAVAILVWELTKEVTAIALIGFFTQIPSLLVIPLAGGLVDRSDRKFLIALADLVAGFSTIALLFLYLTDHLQIWHFYAAGMLNGAFGQIQRLAYTASITVIVPPAQYARASGMGSIVHYGSAIIAPALAGVLYGVIGLVGIWLIDLGTFVYAFITLLCVTIPNPKKQAQKSARRSEITPPSKARAISASIKIKMESVWQDLNFGIGYVRNSPSLLALLIINTLFQFAHDLGASLYSPMILARTGNNAKALGNISSAAGLGGVLGAAIASIWSGSQRKIKIVLLGMIGAGVSKTVFGLGQSLWFWMPAQFCSSINFPLMNASKQAILLNKVEPEVQGRIFALSFLLTGITAPIGRLLAGYLADRILEPAMQPGGTLAGIFGIFFGTNEGSGIALLYVFSSVCLILIGLAGHTFASLRNIETLIPDRKTTL